MKVSSYALPHHNVLIEEVLKQVAALSGAPSAELLKLVTATRALNSGFWPTRTGVVAVVRQAAVASDLANVPALTTTLASFPTDVIDAAALSTWATTLP